MTDVVDGMAKAVEDRRHQLGMDLATFREATGLTGQALLNVRKGLRRAYAESTQLAVASALRWEMGWYDRLLAGEAPVEKSDPVGSEPSVDRTEFKQLVDVVGALGRAVLESNTLSTEAHEILAERLRALQGERNKRHVR